MYFTFRCFNVIRKEGQSNKLRRGTSQSKITTQSFLSDLFRRGEWLPVWQRHRSRMTCLLSYACIAWLTTPDHSTTQETYLQLFCSWNLWDWLLAKRQTVFCKKFLQRFLADFHTDNTVSHVRQPAHSRERSQVYVRPAGWAITKCVSPMQHLFIRETLVLGHTGISNPDFLECSHFIEHLPSMIWAYMSTTQHAADEDLQALFRFNGLFIYFYELNENKGDYTEKLSISVYRNMFCSELQQLRHAVQPAASAAWQ